MPGAVRTVLFAALWGCGGKRVFHCDTHLQCVRGADQGACVGGGCAFPDPGCPGGGLRWVEESPVAPGTCVDEAPDGTAAVADARPAGWDGPCLIASQVAAGARHSCLLTGGGDVYCFGANDTGQLGDEGGDSPAPVRVLGGAMEIAAGGGHACARLTDGTVSCWGANQAGQVGRGGTSARAAPGVIADLAAVEAIGAGAAHSCAVRADDVWCWGDNGDGQVAGAGGDTTRPVLAAAHVKGTTGPYYQGLALGRAHTVAIDPAIPFVYDGGVYTWGADAPQLGRAWSAGSGRIDGIAPDDVAAGDEHSCATDAGALSCWGRNGQGQLGVEGADSATPRPVTLPGAADEVSAGAGHTCVRGGDAVLCFGDGGAGQLGVAESGPLARTPVPGTFRQVSAGGAHTCAVDLAGRVWCWGANDRGQLGRAQDGTSAPQRIVAACP